VAVLMLYPLVWLVGATFKSNAEIFTEIGFMAQPAVVRGLRQGLEDQHRVHLRHLLPELAS
jgi:oligogalacturonide transport system permease protein